MSLVRFELNTKAIDPIAEKIDEGIIAGLEDTKELGLRLLLEKAPVRTGNLRSGISAERNDMTVIFKSSAPYTWFVAKGTAPHIILPRIASVLRFEVDGQVIFARRVNHPGTEANPFIDETRETLIQEAPSLLRKRIQEKIKTK